MRNRPAAAFLGVWAALAAAACEAAPGGRDRGAPESAIVRPSAGAASRLLTVRERIPAFLAPNGDSLLVTPASASAIAGRRLAAVLTYDDRLAVYDLDARAATLLGGKGSGPGELTGGMWSVALSPNGHAAAASAIDGRVHAWAPDGSLIFSRSVTPMLDLYPTVGLDDSGRAYVAAESFASGKRRVRLIRLGREPEDSTGSAWLDVPQPIVRTEARAVRRWSPSFEYVYGNNPGKLWWGVSGAGLVYLANADRYRVDTMHLGGGRGTLVHRPDVRPEEASAAERERILASYRRSHQGKLPVTERELGTMRRAPLNGLFVAGDELWVARGLAADGARKHEYDVYDARTGRVRQVVTAPQALIGVGLNAALGAKVDEDGNRSLVLLDVTTGGASAGDSSALPRVITPLASVARAGAGASAGGTAAPTATEVRSDAAARARVETSGRYPGMGCSILPGRSTADSMLVRVRIEAGPPNRRQRVLARVIAGAATGSRPTAALAVVGEDAGTSCSGGGVEFTITGTLRLDLRVSATASRVVVLTLYDANDSRRSVTRVIRPADGEVPLVLPRR